MPYTLSEEQKKQFAGIYLLEYMINAPKAFELLLAREEADLEPILEWLLVKGHIDIVEASHYSPNKLGREALKRFMLRYSEFLNVFDVFSAVDLAAGEFAFAHYFEFEEDAQWNAFLKNERWEDLRIAVAEFKGIDAVEIVFMSFLSEGRFGRDKTGWQFDLLLGTVWDEILAICNTAITAHQLAYEDEGQMISGDTVLSDIIEQGTELILNLHAHEANLAKPLDHYESDSKPIQVDRVNMPEQRSFNDYQDPRYRPDFWDRKWNI